MFRYINQPSKKANHRANPEISRIISAAVVNKRFCSALLKDPSTAISQGFFGEPFRLSLEQQNRISMIKENSLEGFASQLAQL
jgi:hypothetical protein